MRQHGCDTEGVLVMVIADYAKTIAGGLLAVARLAALTVPS